MNKFWTQSYPKGVSAQISPAHSTLIDIFDDKLAEYASQEFITNMGVTYSYGQIDKISLDIAA